MTEDRTTPIMFLALGLVLVVIGIPLCLVTQTQTQYRTIYGVQVPIDQVTVQPYLWIGGAMAIVGIVIAIVGLRAASSPTYAYAEAQPQQAYCAHCGKPLQTDELFCRDCGAKKQT